MFSNIVVGTDGSKTSKGAVARALDLARNVGATVHMVHAFKFSSTEERSLGARGDPVVSGVVKDYLDAVMEEAQAGAEGVRVETYAATIAPADALVQIAEQVDADLIVVGSKGMQGVHRLLGSVPNSVAHAAPCHVLIVKTA